MASPHPLVDSLTSHIALFHSHSHQSANPNPNPRSPIVRWFFSLPLPSRQSILTFTDPAFVQILLQMQAHLASRGPTLFFLLPDLPSGPAALPSLCSRSAHGLLAREIAKFELANSLLLFGSMDEDVLDSVTVSGDLVGSVDGFVEVMDGLSNGMFLRGEEVGLGEEWKEVRWLKDKGYYSLDEFVANRLEVVLRRSLGGSGAGKKGKGKVKGSVATAESMFWRKKGCMDWWAVLDPGLRREFCCGFLGMAMKSLVISLKKTVPFAVVAFQF